MSKKDHKTPSKVLFLARFRSGAGKHSESKNEKNKRTGRLRGVEKKNLQNDQENI